jgi:cytidylate kinase
MGDLMGDPDPRPPVVTELFSDLAQRIRRGTALVGTSRLVCIDGPAGSGKTTFAKRLATELGASLVHMDDLYDGWAGAFDPALPQRVDAWLLTPWRHGISGQHPVFDWSAHRYTQWRHVVVTPEVIVEGVGAAHEGLREHATETIWVEADRSLRWARLLERDGEHDSAHLEEFVAREQQLFSADNTRANASMIVVVDSSASPTSDHYVRLA